jgi:1-acyl-sn-glycerol-3-phosphate acyltransferase
VRYVISVATYIAMHLLFSVLWVPLAVLLLHGGARRWFLKVAFHRSLAFFVLHYWRWLRMYRIAEISGLERALAQGPAVYVSNHRGRIDGLFILSLVPNTGVVMKASYIRQPLFATFARWLDFVSVDADAVSGLGQSVERCRQVLGAGRNLLVFPEGTRSPGARLLPFRDTAFRLAQATGVPVVPVVVHTDTPVLGKRMGVWGPSRTFALTVRFMEPARAGETERPGDFCARVERDMARTLAELDRGTEWDRSTSGRS